jgi:histidinol dehydrogenase
MPRKLHINDDRFDEELDRLLERSAETLGDVETAVAAIIADVRQRGDAALVELTARFDRHTLTASTLAVTPEEIAAARAKCDAEALAALALAARRIEAYHREGLPKDGMVEDETGARLGWRWTALTAVGIYVPGGLASYPSSVLMNAIPARVAGVERIVMTVPTPEGKINPLVLAAADLAGVTEIYRIGGAQAVAALAYGTATIRPVDKITGPGNAYVAAAKRQVFGQVGIDMVAGPSEIAILADGANDPEWIAADLLSQAEHDGDAQSILLTDDFAFGEAVEKAVQRQLATLPRRAIAQESWEDNGAIITLERLDQAPGIIDRIAPEHLELAIEDPEALLPRIRHAGAVFLGRYTPEAAGDYVAGPNHVLPTARSARFSSGLSTYDFLKRSTVTALTQKALAAIGPAAATLAAREGLDGHGRSVTLRLQDKPTG